MENQNPSIDMNSARSRKIVLLVGVFVLVLLSSVFFISRMERKVEKEPLSSIPENAQYVQDKLLVQFNPEYEPAEEGKNTNWDKLYSKLQKLGVSSYEKVFESDDPLLRYHYHLFLKKGAQLEKIREEIYNLEGVDSSEPDYRMTIQEAVNDTHYSGMWGLQKINIQQAWDITKGSNDVTVAVIDTGIDYNHPDFVGRKIIKGKDFSKCGESGCSPSNEAGNDPMDDHGHGTHVAGTIGAMTNNGTGVAGINWNVALLAIKTMDRTGNGHISNIANGIRYAVDNSAHVVNLSIGAEAPCTATYRDVIEYARSQGVTVIVAAGNDGIDASKFAPANCNGVIVVGAADQSDQRSIWPKGGSNYGGKVDISAPGTTIYSTTRGGRYESRSGTSMAAPHVSGVAALLLAQTPTYSPDDIKKCLLDSADPITTDKLIGNKRLNAYKAVNGCGQQISDPKSGDSGSLNLPNQGFYAQGRVMDDANKNAKIDSDEGALSGAKIVLKGPVNREMVTGADGKFMIPNLQKGRYVLQVMNGNTPVMEYRFWITDEDNTWDIHVPMPVKPSANNQGNMPKGTITPTPRTLYTCFERVSSRTANDKAIQMKYMECHPK